MPVTIDQELESALAEFGGGTPRSRAIRDLAVRGASALRAGRDDRAEALETLRQIAAGEDEGFDFAVSDTLHLETSLSAGRRRASGNIVPQDKVERRLAKWLAE